MFSTSLALLSILSFRTDFLDPVWEWLKANVFPNAVSTVLWLLGIALTTLVAWLARKFIAWLKIKFPNQCAIELAELVYNAVIAVQQSYVDQMKKRNRFNADEQAEALNKAFAMVWEQASDKVRKYLSKKTSDTESFIKALIEVQLKENKENGTNSGSF